MIKSTTEVREGNAHQLEFNRQLLRVPFLDGREIVLSTEGRYLLKVNHGLGRPYRGFLQLNGSCGLVEDTSNPDKDRQLWLRLGNPWQLIDEQRVAAATTNVTFSGLNGDNEQAYRYEIFWVSNSTTASTALTLQPNSLSTNQETLRIVLDETPTSSVALTADLIMGFMGAPSVSDTAWIHGTFYAKSGEERFNTALQSHFDASSTAIFGRDFFGYWSNTSTIVTSVNFNASAASAIGVGSVFRLFRRGASNQKLKLWVF